MLLQYLKNIGQNVKKAAILGFRGNFTCKNLNKGHTKLCIYIILLVFKLSTNQ